MVGRLAESCPREAFCSLTSRKYCTLLPHLRSVHLPERVLNPHVRVSTQCRTSARQSASETLGERRGRERPGHRQRRADERASSKTRSPGEDKALGRSQKSRLAQFSPAATWRTVSCRGTAIARFESPSASCEVSAVHVRAVRGQLAKRTVRSVVVDVCLSTGHLMLIQNIATIDRRLLLIAPPFASVPP